ncbi:M14 family zinc carboxypeptidase, partial [Flavobacterium sp.]|uniref:M14 family zinc carboxypeptidase n=1 Tax=Flavobacterium sp. TaxID=239 RepID=UPI00375198BB
MKRITYLTLFLVFFTTALFAQKSTSLERANKYLAEKGEVIFTFKATSQNQFFELNEILSVSHRRVDQKNLEVEAYANKSQFEKFLTYRLPFQVTAADNEIAQEIRPKKNGKIASTWDTAWDSYPQYSEYVAKMNYWANTYPNLCTLQSIGTTPNGRTLYVLKISDNASSDETEPEFLYTSSMHGDEITGYPTMLHLIDYLLTNYGSLSEVTNLVNGTELYICPLANPDGSYKTAGNDILNSTGNTATRANANGVDLNRNYPDPIGGIHPDGLAYQPETLAFLNFEQTRNFVLAANYHGGAEVVNFPWDTSTAATGSSAVSIHPHDSYFRYVSQEYAQLAQTADGDLNYMDDVYGTGQFPGTTNGAIWYTVKGGRQDNNNFYNHNKEVTIEISATKFPLASTLLFYWDRNKQALLNYIKQASYGLQGVVT